MNVEFGLNNTIIVSSPNGGESIDENQTINITWIGNIVGNVNIDLYKNGTLHQSIATNEANDGSYSWNLGGTVPVGTDYRIHITSVDNNAITDSSDADFSITTEVFPENGTFPSGFTQTAGSTKSWIVATDHTSEGGYSLKNDDIGNSQNASVEHTGDFQAGNITFDVRVSSEPNYDFLRFYIDGVEQDINTSSSSQTGLSGNTGWISLSFPVTAGTHTFRWSYIKDSSVSSNDDTVWLDNLILPNPPLTGIALWKQNQFGANAGNESIAGDNADPDGDGIVNILEYALNLDPNTVNTSMGISADSTASTVSIIYPRNTGASDLEYIVEYSTNLNPLSWTKATVTEQILGTNGNTETVEATMTMGSESRYFLRLRVENQ